MSMNLLHEREQIMKVCLELASSGYNPGTWGNLSIIDRKQELVVITPSGVDYKTMKLEDLVVVNLDGNVVEGNLRPSVETGMHIAIYKSRPDVISVVHTHSVYATAAATARKPLPAVVEDMAQIIGGDALVAEYALPGTEQLAQNAVAALGERNAALLANHGVVGVGPSLKEANLACHIVEKTAMVYAFAKLFGEPVHLSDEDIYQMHDFYKNKYKQKQ